MDTQYTNITGLTYEQVEQSRKKYGNNSLSQEKQKSLWKEFFLKFTDPIILILLTALIFSMGIAFYEYNLHNKGLHSFLEPIGIAFAIVLATGVAFYFEQKANKQFEILNKVNEQVYYKVIRQGQITQVLKKDIVVGDWIRLETGDEIPADGKLIQAVQLQINESTLTGESLVDKTTNPADFDVQATYPSNYLYRGTTIISGYATLQITQVGDATEYGKIHKGIQIDSQVKTPLNMQLETLAKQITRISYAVAILVVLMKIIVYFSTQQNYDWITLSTYFLQTIMIAVTIVVVSVPEGLPMSVTLSLAYSMHSMLKSQNLVRKMHSCETMGAVTTICTDKTGTLTQNQMTLQQSLFATDSEFLIPLSMAINSTADLDFTKSSPRVLGNPTEGALLLWLYKKGFDYQTIRSQNPILWQEPFSTQNKYMATATLMQNEKVIWVKGAPEILMQMCQWQVSDTPSFEKYQEHLLQYQSQGMRTIAFAYKKIPINAVEKEHINNLTFLGIVAIADPIRADVPQAIEQCIEAGIKIKIITGDTPKTAQEIARQIGLWKPSFSLETNHISGADFAQLTDNQAIEQIENWVVISRARPDDKARLVKLLQDQGEVVAVTGDGTNDALALKLAQVGLSMGDGTAVAKQASDMTILDNAFSSITRAVLWGRSLYANIQRFIIFQMTINLVACLIVLIGAFLGVESPLTVTQMLWVNLIMDTFAALALASLPPNVQVMKNKPRSQKENIITVSMQRFIFGIGLIFVLFLFGLMQYFKHENITALTDFSWQQYMVHYVNFTPTMHTLSKYELSVFFSTFVMLQFWNMFNAKAFLTGQSAFHQIVESKGFITIAGIILLGQIILTHYAGEMLQVTPLSLYDWIILIGATSVVLCMGELYRFFKKIT